MGGHKPRRFRPDWLSQRINDDFTLRGLVAELAGRGLKVDFARVFRACQKLSFKKSVAAGERDRPDVARRRVQWTKYQDRVEAERLVFIDETWTRTDMAPAGMGTARTQLPTKVPHGRWKTMTFLAALRSDRIDAPWFIEDRDGESFRTYVAKVLLPTLRPGLVVMDNLGSHRSKAVRQLIRSAGAKLFFLPKYSPDLNPIEQVFAKLKHLLRKAAARTVDAVCAAIGELLDASHPKNARTISKTQAIELISRALGATDAGSSSPRPACGERSERGALRVRGTHSAFGIR